jgi:hypothetical protein
MKNDEDDRIPIPSRVKSQFFMAALSFSIERMLERALRDAGVSLSAGVDTTER